MSPQPLTRGDTANAKKEKKTGPKLLSLYAQEIENLIKNTYLQLSEKDRRTYAAVETLNLPRGGIAYFARLVGCSRNTIMRGIDELSSLAPKSNTENRSCKKGGGRKPTIEIIENIDQVFLKVIDHHIAGDPMDEKIHWTNLSQKQIATKMQEQGNRISVTVVKKLLKEHGFTKRKALKKKPIGTTKHRNEQFENIVRLKDKYIKDGNPIISVDIKKKNL